MIIDRKPYKILVVEDNPGDYAIVEDFLTEKILSPAIERASAFREAAAILSDGKSIFDVILLDLSLPDKEGKQLVSEMLNLAPICPIVILTGYSDIDFSIKSISDGISDYLVKDDLNAALLYKSIIYSIERKKTITLLKESEKRYSDLFHLSPQPMWVYDLESLRFIKVNNAAVQNYGYTEEEFLSMTIRDIRPEEDLPIIDEAIQLIKNNNQFFSKGINRHKRKNGDIIYVEAQESVFNFGRRKTRLILACDVTERFQYIKAIENQNKQLHDIAWTQSHVVRAPLARMMGIVNLVKELGLEAPESEELLAHFEDSGVELDAIIKDIIKKSEQIDSP